MNRKERRRLERIEKKGRDNMNNKEFIKKMTRVLNAYYRNYGGEKIDDVSGYKFLDVYDNINEPFSDGYCTISFAIYYNRETEHVIQRISCWGTMNNGEDVNLEPIYCEVPKKFTNRYNDFLEVVEEWKELWAIDLESEFIDCMERGE